MGVALSSKMYVPQGVQVPCVNLAADVDLDDIHPWAADLDTAQKMVSEGTAPSLFYFVENAKQLELLTHEQHEPTERVELVAHLRLLGDLAPNWLVNYAEYTIKVLDVTLQTACLFV